MGGPGLSNSRYAPPGSSSLNSTPEPSRQSSLNNVFSAPPPAVAQPQAGFFATPITPAASMATLNGISSSAQTTTKVPNGADFFATPSAPVDTTTIKKDNEPPAAKTSSYRDRINKLKAKRTAPSGAEAADTPPPSAEMKHQLPIGVTTAKSTQIHEVDHQDGSGVTLLKAEEKRCQAERVEAERRAKAQADLKAVLARIARLEEIEQDRLATSRSNIASAKEEYDGAKAFFDEIEQEKSDNVRILQDSQEQLAKAQALIQQFTNKIAENEGNLEEAREIVEDSGRELSNFEAANAAAIAEHKDRIDVLLKDQARLEQIIGGASSVDDCPALSTSAAASPQTLRAVTPMDEDGQVPVAVVKDEPVIKQDVMEDDFVAQAANKLREVPPLAVKTNSWVKPILRKPSVVRTVNLTNLNPASTTIAYVTGLVWGGALHSIKYTPGDSVAKITFLRAEDCTKYLAATQNGIQCPNDGNRTVIPQPCEPESGSMEHLEIMLAKGHTRCVRVVDIEPDWKGLALKKLAETGGLHPGVSQRKVERLVNGHDAAKRRIVDFRFCKVADAVLFSNFIGREEDFNDCHVSFTADPCAKATGVHKGLM